jgi:O-antigen/teichoic acid export membrane protein
MQTLSRKRSLKLNALSNWMTLAVNVAVGFLLTPFVFRSLDKPGYGIWTLVGSFVGYYGLLNLGVGSAITRYVARYAGQGDEKALNETASTAMAMFCCTGTLAALLAFFIAEPLARFFDVRPEHLDDFRRVVRIMGLATAITFPANVLGTIIRAHERFVAANGASVFTTLLRAGLVVVLLRKGWGLSGVALATLTSELAGLIANVVLCRLLTPHIRIRLSLAKLNVLGTLIAYGGVTFVIVIADIMRSNLDSLVIGKWVDMATVGIYGIAGTTIIGYMIRLVTAGLGVLTPRFAALDGHGDHAEVRRLLVRSLTVSSTLAFGASMMAIIFGKSFILWWMGRDALGAVPILWILATGGAFALAQNPAIGFMYAVNKHYLYAIATILEAIANLTLSILLVYRYGSVGVALGTLIPMLLVKVLVMPVYVSRIAGMPLLDYVKPMLPACLVGTTLTLGAVLTGIATRETATFRYLITGGAVVGVIYASAFWVVTPARYRVFPNPVTMLLPRIRSRARGS